MTAMGALPPLPVTGVDHIGVVVADFAPVVAVFQAIPLAQIGQVEPHPEIGLDILFIEIGGLKIELLCPSDPHGRAADLIAAGRSGINHLALTVTDLEKSLRSLEEAGIGLIDRVGRPGAHGAMIAFLDPTSLSGTSIELVEHVDPRYSIQSADPFRKG